MPNENRLPPDVRRVPAGRGADWWSGGWLLFKAAPWLWIALIATWIVVNLALVQAGTLGNILASLLTPVFAAGLLFGARELDGGRPLRYEYLFAGFGGGRLLPLVGLGLLNLALSFVAVALAVVVALPFVEMSALMQLANVDVNTVGELDGEALLPFLVVMVPVFAIGMLGVFAATWFAPGLVALHGVSPWRALGLSLAGIYRNIGATLIYHLILIGLAIAASIPLGLGWIVLAPVLAASWYANLRDLYGNGLPVPVATAG